MENPATSDRPKDIVDPVAMTVIYNRLVGICREMGTTMMRASYSPIFSESLDFSCVLFDRHGRMMAQSEFCPAQVGAIRFVVKWLIAEIGAENLRPGDVVIHNDPYRGGAHIPEHVVIKPVYYDSELFGYVSNIAHMVEIGGMAVGGFAATATEVYQEGPAASARMADAGGRIQPGRMAGHHGKPSRSTVFVGRPARDDGFP